MSATSTASIPVTQDAVEVARRAAAEFTARGVPVPALLELIAHTTAGHQITSTELPTPGHGADAPRHGRTTPLPAHR